MADNNDDDKTVYTRVYNKIIANNVALGPYLNEAQGHSIRDELAKATPDYDKISDDLTAMGKRMAASPAYGTPEKAEAKLTEIFGAGDFSAVIGQVPGDRGWDIFKKSVGLDDPGRNAAGVVNDAKHDNKKAMGLMAEIAGVIGCLTAKGLFAKLGMLTLFGYGIALSNNKGISDLVSGLWDGGHSAPSLPAQHHGHSGPSPTYP